MPAPTPEIKLESPDHWPGLFLFLPTVMLLPRRPKPRIGSRDLGETDGPSVFLVFKLDGSGRQLQNRCSLALSQERQ